jgi:hypothetical protein
VHKGRSRFIKYTTINLHNKSNGYLVFKCKISLDRTENRLGVRREALLCMPHGLINYIDTKAKCRHLKIDLYIDFAAGFYLTEAPTLLGFCLGYSCNFVGSESGQIHSVKLLQNMVPNTLNTPPPPSHTLSVYAVI